MSTLLVERIEPYAPGDESASVTLRSSSGEIEVFCHPCNLKVGQQIANRLSAIDAEVIAAYLSDWPEEEKANRSKEWLEKIGPYSYRGCAHVVSQKEGLIEVLGFQIEVGEVLCDGAVEFKFMRVDT